MKIHKTLPIGAALVGAFLVAGCKSSTTGSAQAETTALHMDDLRSSIEDMKTTTLAATTSLANVVKTAEQDPKPAFEQFKKDSAAVEAALTQSEKNLQSMKSTCQTYFAQWQQEAATMTDPKLREKAEQRRTKLSKAVDGVTKAMDGARAEIAPFMISLKDVQTYLTNDLTPSGIKSIKDKPERLEKDAKSLGNQLDEVIEAIEEGAPEFRTAAPPAPAKT